jgi:hypothetical protein
VIFCNRYVQRITPLCLLSSLNILATFKHIRSLLFFSA